MIEKSILDYLESNIDIPVLMETPKPVPEEYILIQKTGGGMTDHIYNAQIAIQSISSKSLYRAVEINDEMINYMIHIADNTGISSCRLNSDYNFTNTETKQYRYQAVFDLYY